MAFCSSCGAQMDDNCAFCPSCGAQKAAPAPAPAPAPVQTQAPVYQQPVYQQPVYQQPVYIKPKIAGRGFGISSLVLSIIGLVYAVYMFMAVAVIADTFFIRNFLDEMIAPVLVYSVLSILGVSFGAAAKSRGYRTGVSTSGLVMGIIGLVLYVLCIIICAAS